MLSTPGDLLFLSYNISVGIPLLLGGLMLNTLWLDAKMELNRMLETLFNSLYWIYRSYVWSTNVTAQKPTFELV